MGPYAPLFIVWTLWAQRVKILSFKKRSVKGVKKLKFRKNCSKIEKGLKNWIERSIEHHYSYDFTSYVCKTI